MTLQLDDNGLQIQTQQEIIDELALKLKAKFGPNLKTKLASIMGQLINVVAELRADDQQALLAVYRSIDPNGAVGRALDARLTLTGSTRKGATSSVVDGVLTFSSGGTMNNGDFIKNADNNTIWQLTDGPHTSSGPSWPEVIPAQMTAVSTGPIEANAGTTWEAVTVVAGLDGFTNPTDDAEIGRDRELDGPARRRRLQELYSQGQGPLAAIEGYLSKASGTGIQTVRVYHNPATFPADSDSIPFKAFNVVAETSPSTPTAAQQQAIWDAIFAVMGAGGEAYGTDYAGTVTDSEGSSHNVAFDTITIQNIAIEIDLVTSTSEDAITPNLEAVVAAEVLSVAQGNWEKAGRDVRALDISGVVGRMLEDGDISGVDAVTVRLAIDPASPTAVAKLSIGIREKPDFDSALITVAQT